ncbi:hypothetical protein D3C79_961330 [compost metagenome]
MRIDSAEHLHQRGLPGPVLSAECMDFACLHLQVYVREGFDPGKSLRDALHLQNILTHQSLTQLSLVLCSGMPAAVPERAAAACR